MGYKLAGYDHLGGVEIDPRMAKVYQANHNPRHLFLQDLREFNRREDLPDELYRLDLLDGSPPCSTFSTAGSREEAWGVKKAFREGQATQTLDDLVDVYADTILKLKPKTFVLENVSGLAKGNAKAYLKAVMGKLSAGGYAVQAFLLNGATMGLPQKRERVFVVGAKAEYRLPKLAMDFSCAPVTFSEIIDKDAPEGGIVPSVEVRLPYAVYGDANLAEADMRYRGKGSFFNNHFIYEDRVVGTISTKHWTIMVWEKGKKPRAITDKEIVLASSFPLDYCFGEEKPAYLCGMSVPPVMAANVGHEIYSQWLSKIK